MSEGLDKNDFRIIGPEDVESGFMEGETIGYWRSGWLRFRENKTALFFLALLVLIILLTFIGPLFSMYDMETVNIAGKNEWPGKAHWFGTDRLGRDLFTRVWIGGRVSVMIGFLGAFVVSAVGCLYGGVSAYFGGTVDIVMMRVVEILRSVPHLLVVIMISVVFDSKSIPTLLFAMTVTGWCATAQLVRAQMLAISAGEYVTAAKLMHVPPIKIVFRHLIPNSFSVIVVNTTFSIPGFIFGESFLSYVGLGVQPPDTSWGALAASASESLMLYPYQVFPPTLLIALTMLCFTLIGDGLRDALDPKLWR
ncbi:MAG: ABC transporter permease [Clostridiales Family XIII bacterium]|jgi:oligopeptide transport system permease protein|nr:ABC transporter permease [Clostridiales Family XIII bacterium]